MRIKEHDKGWWECFETFAAKVLFFAPNTGETICKGFLKDAELPSGQVEAWLEKQKEKPTAKDCVIALVKSFLIERH